MFLFLFTGISLGKRQTFIEVPKADVGVLYTYTPLTITYCGPEPPGYNALEQHGYLKHLRFVSYIDVKLISCLHVIFQCRVIIMSIQNP